ncbi:LuxR C-terminal-related transcriptional regulator [Streptomyces sp. NPDC006368]|uniref:helix-turn-helix transcriptional regulator n=1 Tax=Streptomyces sp. NPDC006368 TaxID=3156760 RepID=UPI0033A4ECA8
MTGIHGRSAELEAVAALFDGLRSGHGGVLLIAAEPGLGRTALLRRAATDAGADRALYTRAARAERDDLPYSGLYALLSAAGADCPVGAAGGVEPGGWLSLLRGRAATGPLLVCVDDAHLWDARSRAALGFAARRAESLRTLGLLLSVAGHRAQDPDFAGLPVVRLGPLPDRAASALVDELTGGGADPAVREELLYEAEGNPALIEALVGRLTPAQLAGHAPLPRPLADSGALLRTFGCRLEGLPPDTRLMLLLAAAAQELSPGTGAAGADTTVVLRAARAAGIAPGALDAAEAAGVARATGDAGQTIRFESPLLRRTVLSGAALSRRRAAHALLASVLTEERHRFSRLLHRAFAAEGPDPRLAADLAAAAGTGTPPGATPLERSVALARAAELTTDTDARASRWTSAAELAGAAGRPRRARHLLTAARRTAQAAGTVTRTGAGTGTRAVPGRAELVDGTLTLYDGPAADAHAVLRVATALLEPYDPERALAARLGAMDAAWAMGDIAACLSALAGDGAGGGGGGGGGPSLPRLPGEHAMSHLYRTGLHTALSGRLAEAREPLRQLLDLGAGDDDPTRLLHAGGAALVLGDIRAACHTNALALALARTRGLTTVVPRALERLAYAELRAGRHARARVHAQEGLRAAHRSGLRNVVAHQHAVLALVASVEGDAGAVAGHAGQAMAVARPHGLVQASTLAEWATARADLGRGRAYEAVARLGPLVRPGPRCGHFAVRMLAVPCFVEAAVLAGEGDDARAAAEEFALWAAQGADPQAPAQLARCRALLAAPEQADALYAEALERHDEAGGDFERARTLLQYGKWLRRRRRPREARGRLRDALVAFERSGAGPWAEQTRAELRATGDTTGGASGEGLRTPRERVAALPLLTPQQLRIARCVAEGATNREVAMRLSISPRTVDHHLRNVFVALQVRSRVELSRLMDRVESDHVHRDGAERNGVERDGIAMGD